MIPSIKIWTPDIVLYNSIGANLDNRFPSQAKVFHNGSVRWFPPTITEASCLMDVQYFPFDTQHCRFRYGSWSNDISGLDLRNIGSEADLGGMVRSGEWRVISFMVRHG